MGKWRNQQPPTEKEIKAFVGLKESLTNKNFLMYPNFSKEFTLCCDASDYALGAVLSRFDEDNKEKFDSLLPGLKFIVKHVPVHKDHRYWYDKGYTYISAAKNTGILHADGEVCVTCDDAEFFPSHFY
jgi:hypothetical protein